MREVRANFEARIASGEFQRVSGQKHDTGRQFTTAETIRPRKKCIRQMQQGQNRARADHVDSGRRDRTDSRYEQLNTAQRCAVGRGADLPRPVQGLQGSAGVGKDSTLCDPSAKARSNAVICVEGFAPTSRAAQQLRDAGISADTLQGFLARHATSRRPEHASLHGRRIQPCQHQADARLSRKRSVPATGCCFIGDTRQHQGVDAGKPFEQLRAGRNADRPA